jgi:hypothetical protein
LTVALLLLMVGASLVAALAWLRAGLPGDEIAAAQRLALARADEAIQGFASIHHRLPCPADTPLGGENCGLAKGYLPASVLMLDAALHTPNTLTARYMVYRKADADLAANAPVTVADGSTRPLPGDAYDPTPKDFSGDLFNARNGLDLCETMRLAYEGRAVDAASHAHYKRAGTPVSVAYGLALPGAGDRADDGSAFDGANAGNAPEMEAPDRGHGISYDDFVFVRDFPSLMSAFDCQPVDYQVTANRTDEIDAKIEFDTSVFDSIISEFGGIDWQKTEHSTTLEVKYDRTGVASPVTASVDALAMSFDVIAKAEKQRESVRKSAKSAYDFGVISSVTGVFGNVLSTLKIVDSTISIATSAAKAAACLGLCVNQYVAIGLNVAAIALETAALGSAIANTVKVIQSTVKYNQIYARLGGDANEASDFCEVLEENDKGQADLLPEMEKQLEEMEQQVNNAKSARDAAEARVMEVDTRVRVCMVELIATKAAREEQIAANQEPTIVDRSAEADYYEPFLYPSGSENSESEIFGIFAKINAADRQISEIDQEIAKQDTIIENTDTTKQGVLDQLSLDAAEYRKERAVADPSLTEAQLDEIEKNSYQQRLEQAKANYLAAVIQKAVYQESRKSAVSAAAAAREELQTTITGIPADTGSGIAACEAANRLIRESYAVVEYPEYVEPPPGEEATIVDEEASRASCVAALTESMGSGSDAFCADNHYYDEWMEYRQKEELYVTMRDQYEEFGAMVQNQRDSPSQYGNACSLDGAGMVQLWPADEAHAILRQADKRGGLQ